MSQQDRDLEDFARLLIAAADHIRHSIMEYLEKLFMIADITDEYGDMADTEPYETAIDMAVEALKAQRWILCSECKPRQQQPVIVTDEGDVLTAYINSLNEWMDFHGNRLKGVSAWMPLPEPYAEEQP